MSIKLKDTIYDLVNNADKIDNLDSTSLFRKLGTNVDINTFADNSNKNGIIYINTTTPANINAPFSYGTILSFNSDAGSWMLGNSSGGTLKFRSRWWSGNGGTWGDWKDIAFKTDIPTIPTALKNPKALTIQNNGTTVDSYDGSAAKTINITHPTIPTSLKCPTSLTIQFNGTSQGAWDGSTAKTINITPAAIGAATSGHTHDYAANYQKTCTVSNTNGSSAWYTILSVGDSTNSPVLVSVRAYAHSSITFIACKGYSTSGSINVLNYCASGNGSYPYVKGVRLLSDGKVQVYLNSPTTLSGNKIQVNVFCTGSVTITTTLTYETGSPTVIAEPTLNDRGISTLGNITAAKFVKSGSSDSYVLLGAGGSKAISDFATSGHTHNYAGSSSAGGAATSANKLSTARTISLTGSVTGSGSFDGSGNLSIATTTNHSHSGYASSSHTHNYAGSSSPGGAATSALTISASAPQLAAAGESNNINIVNNANSSITTNSPESLAAITKAIRFRWYNDYWEIGSIRGSSNKSIGFGFTINNNNLRFRITSDAAYVGSSTVLHTGNWSTYCAAKSHNHSGVLDSGNSTFTTFAYSKAGLNYSDYTWLAGWNGYELRAVNKSQFAQASHTHDYAASNHSHSGYMTTSSPSGSGTLMMNGSNSRGSYPSVKWHIPNVNWAQIIMNGSGELEFRGGGTQDASYITTRMGACVCTSLYVGGEQITFTT